MLPTLLELGPITLHTYSVALALAFYFAFVTANNRAHRAGFDMDLVGRMQVLIVLSALAGARALFVWTEREFYAAHPIEALYIWQGGMVFYGGLLAALATAVWFAWRHGISVLKGLDIAATAIPVGQLVGRLGCFAEGCCYGVASSLPWAVAFPAGGAEPRHPTQLYEAAAMGAIVLLLHRWYEKPNRSDGMIMVGYLYLYGVTRYAIELLRGDDRGGVFLGGFSISQLISVGVLATGALMHAWLATRRAPPGTRPLPLPTGNPSRRP